MLMARCLGTEWDIDRFQRILDQVKHTGFSKVSLLLGQRKMGLDEGVSMNRPLAWTPSLRDQRLFNVFRDNRTTGEYHVKL